MRCPMKSSSFSDSELHSMTAFLISAGEAGHFLLGRRLDEIAI